MGPWYLPILYLWVTRTDSTNLGFKTYFRIPNCSFPTSDSQVQIENTIFIQRIIESSDMKGPLAGKKL